jgi:ribosome-binding protein aMBF1 (putative translation factor)
MVLRLARRNHMASTRNEIEMASQAARSRLCAVCGRAPGQVAAVLDGEDVEVCPDCYQYETGDRPVETHEERAARRQAVDRRLDSAGSAGGVS